MRAFGIYLFFFLLRLDYFIYPALLRTSQTIIQSARDNGNTAGMMYSWYLYTRVMHECGTCSGSTSTGTLQQLCVAANLACMVCDETPQQGVSR